MQMLIFVLVLHYVGLSGMIALCCALGMYDLAMVNGAVFLVLLGAEIAVALHSRQKAVVVRMIHTAKPEPFAGTEIAKI